MLGGPFRRPIEVVFYRDLLCPWSYLAARRLEPVLALLEGRVVMTTRPFPAYLDTIPAGPKSRELVIRRLERVAKEPGGGRLKTDLWTGSDPPSSSAVALAAVEAARLQGARPARLLETAISRAAFERGLNVGRAGVVLEVAASLRGSGLDPVRLAEDLASGRELAALSEHRTRARELGIQTVPSLLVDGRWIVAGARSSDAYLTLLMRHLLSREGALVH